MRRKKNKKNQRNNQLEILNKNKKRKNFQYNNRLYGQIKESKKNFITNAKSKKKIMYFKKRNPNFV